MGRQNQHKVLASASFSPPCPTPHKRQRSPVCSAGNMGLKEARWQRPPSTETAPGTHSAVVGFCVAGGLWGGVFRIVLRLLV